MPMLTHHPKFGAMFPSRARASRGFGDGQEILVTSGQVISAFRNAVAQRSAQGLSTSLRSLWSLAQRLLSQATSQGMSFATTAAIGAELWDLANEYVRRTNGGSGSVGGPGSAPTQPPPQTEKSDSTGAVVALGVAAALVIFAVSR